MIPVLDLVPFLVFAPGGFWLLYSLVVLVNAFAFGLECLVYFYCRQSLVDLVGRLFINSGIHRIFAYFRFLSHLNCSPPSLGVVDKDGVLVRDPSCCQTRGWYAAKLAKKPIARRRPNRAVARIRKQNKALLRDLSVAHYRLECQVASFSAVQYEHERTSKWIEHYQDEMKKAKEATTSRTGDVKCLTENIENLQEHIQQQHEASSKILQPTMADLSIATDSIAQGKECLACDVEVERALRYEQTQLRDNLLLEQSLEQALSQSLEVQVMRMEVSNGVLCEASFQQARLRLTHVANLQEGRAACSAEMANLAIVQQEAEEQASFKRLSDEKAEVLAEISTLEEEISYLHLVDAAERERAGRESKLRSLILSNQALRDDRDSIRDRLTLLQAAMRVCTPSTPSKHHRKEKPVLRSSTNIPRSPSPRTPELTHSPNFSPMSPPDCPLPPTPVAGPSPLVLVEDNSIN